MKCEGTVLVTTGNEPERPEPCTDEAWYAVVDRHEDPGNEPSRAAYLCAECLEHEIADMFNQGEDVVLVEVVMIAHA